MNPETLRPRLDAEHVALHEVVSSFCARSIAVESESDEATSSASRRALVDQGLWTVSTPVDLGGSGGSLLSSAVVWEGLGRSAPSLALSSVHTQAAISILCEHPKWYEKVRELSLGKQAAIVDMASTSNTLCLGREDGVRLSGHIGRIDSAGGSPTLVVMGSGEEMATAVVIEPEQIDFGTPLRRTGLPGAETRSAFIFDEGLSQESVLAPAHCWRARLVFRIGVAAILCGIAAVAHEQAVAYAAQRKQFGAPLLALPAVHSMVSKNGDLLRRCVQDVLEVAARSDLGESASYASAAMLGAVSQASILIADGSLQIHGGYGYLREYNIEGHLRNVLSLCAASGAQETQDEAVLRFDSLAAHSEKLP